MKARRVESVGRALTVHVAIDAVVRDVHLAAEEPGNVALLKAALLDGVKVAEPAQTLVGHIGPEGFVVVDRAVVHGLVLGHATDVCAGGHPLNDGVGVGGGGGAAAAGGGHFGFFGGGRCCAGGP